MIGATRVPVAPTALAAKAAAMVASFTKTAVHAPSTRASLRRRRGALRHRRGHRHRLRPAHPRHPARHHQARRRRLRRRHRAHHQRLRRPRCRRTRRRMRPLRRRRSRHSGRRSRRPASTTSWRVRQATQNAAPRVATSTRIALAIRYAPEEAVIKQSWAAAITHRQRTGS